MKALLVATIQFLVASVIGHGQNPPNAECAADTSSADPQVAEVAGSPSATVWVACGAVTRCGRWTVPSGTPVVVDRVRGAWTCVYAQARDGAGPGWIRSSDLRSMHYDLHPPATSWVGLWIGSKDRVAIRLANKSSALHLSGHAEWHGNGGVVHDGDVEGEATPRANHLHLVEEGADSCTLDLTLAGPYLVATDNDRCGGMNVRFEGIWRRARRRNNIQSVGLEEKAAGSVHENGCCS